MATRWVIVILLLFARPAPGNEGGTVDLSSNGDSLDLEDEFDLLELELKDNEVESASKHRQSIFWSPSAITVFSREDIRASGAITLPDLLRRVPGFDVYESKPSFPLLGARALTDDSTNLVLVLVDGREEMVEMVGFPAWFALTIDLFEVERLEVIRGPGSTLYGANAFAAVINITTVPQRIKTGANLTVSIGEQGHQRLFGQLRGVHQIGEGQLSWYAGVGTKQRHCPSFLRNEMKQVPIRAHGAVRYQQADQLDLSLHAGGAFMGKGTLYMHVGDLTGSNLHNHFAMARANLALGEKFRLKIQAYHSRFSSDFHYRLSFQVKTPQAEAWVADVPDFTVDTHSMDSQLQLDFQAFENLLLMAGANLRYTIMSSDKVIPSEMDELRGAGFLHFQFHPWDVLQLTGGLRFDFNTETDSALSPRAVLVYRPWPDHAFRAGYALAFRKPSFIEGQMHLKIEDYNPGFPEVVDVMATQFGNEELINEKVHSFEAGWRSHLFEESLKLSLDLFYNLYYDTIFFEEDLPLRMGFPDIAKSTMRYSNSASEVTAFGGELETSLRVFGDWTLWGNLGLRWVSDSEGGDLISDPRLRINLGVRLNPDAGFFFDLALHYVSHYEMYMMDPENPIGLKFPVPLGENWLLIGRLGQRWEGPGDSRFEAGISVRTPLGNPFREFGGMPIPLSLRSDNPTDFGGEQFSRLISAYLQGGI